MAFVSTKPQPSFRWLIPVVFTATIFLSASLLFFVQPLFTKIVLPHIGGAPAVWTTAMLFFQTVLICGYLYAHIVTRRLPVAAQVRLHLVLWAAALFFLPLAVAEGWKYDAANSTVWQTLMLFAAGVGLPFAVLSANAPLIQAWYTRSGGPSADDPYFLYGASNLGSLIALLAFPLVAEPLFGATQIGIGWMAGFWALGAMLMITGLVARGRRRADDAAPASADAPGLARIAQWALIAFVPSSLMLAVTTKISTDIGALPLVWVVPLSLYLLTFVLVFTARPILSPSATRVGFFIWLGILTAAFSGILGVHISLPIAVLLLAGFFLTALFMHALLYKTRPPAAHLTTFYVTMSVGGALGGLFNSVIAPAIFNDLYEDAITVALAAAILLLGRRFRPHARALQLGILGAGLVLVALLAKGAPAVSADEHLFNWVLFFGVVGMIFAARHRAQTAVCLVIGTLVVSVSVTGNGALLFSDRSFFGTHKVLEKNGLRLYANGVTWHGAQRLDDFGSARPAPQSYYHRNGPVAQIITPTIGAQARTIGIVGLGIGAPACYARQGQSWHFYEIDKTVDRVARDPDLFTFMPNCGAGMPTHLGDARMVLERQDLTFDILVIDAYSSDSVPVHLTTVEAVEIYLDRLAPDGVLVFHISNRYYAIDRPLGRIAAALGLEARIQRYAGNAENDPGDGASLVAAMARRAAAFGKLEHDGRWRPLVSDGGRLWTDDYANPLEILIR